MSGATAVERRQELHAGPCDDHHALPTTIRGLADRHRSAMDDGALRDVQAEASEP